MERCAAASLVLQVGQSWAGAAEGAVAVLTPMALLCTAQRTRGQREAPCMERHSLQLRPARGPLQFKGRVNGHPAPASAFSLLFKVSST